MAVCCGLNVRDWLRVPTQFVISALVFKAVVRHCAVCVLYVVWIRVTADAACGHC